MLRWVGGVHAPAPDLITYFASQHKDAQVDCMNLQVHELVGHLRKMSDEEVEAGVEAINAFGVEP